MRDEQRIAPPRAKQKAPSRVPTGAKPAGQSRPSQPKAAEPRAKASTRPREAVPAPRKKRPPQQRDGFERDRGEYLYPDDAYYRKSAPTRGKPAKGKKRGGKRPKRTSFLHVLFYSTFAMVIALLLSFLIRTFVFEIVCVNGDSMYPTLLPGDWVIVTKFDYWTQTPERDDIIAVQVSSEDGVILRRVVALPNESVQIDNNGDTLIDGVLLGESYVKLRSYDAYPETKLGSGRYFVLADNRDNSQEVKLDSRNEKVGVVSKRNIVGKVRGIVWPLDRR